MGSPYHHYIIADPLIVPRRIGDLLFRESAASALLSAERPQAPSSRRSARRAPRRGLPEDAFVYCSLNGMQKLTALTFDRWARILRRFPTACCGC